MRQIPHGRKYVHNIHDPELIYDSKDLLTECEVCKEKYLPEVFVQIERRRSEVFA